MAGQSVYNFPCLTTSFESTTTSNFYATSKNKIDLKKQRLRLRLRLPDDLF